MYSNYKSSTYQKINNSGSYSNNNSNNDQNELSDITLQTSNEMAGHQNSVLNSLVLNSSSSIVNNRNRNLSIKSPISNRSHSNYQNNTPNRNASVINTNNNTNTNTSNNPTMDFINKEWKASKYKHYIYTSCNFIIGIQWLVYVIYYHTYTTSNSNSNIDTKMIDLVTVNIHTCSFSRMIYILITPLFCIPNLLSLVTNTFFQYIICNYICLLCRYSYYSKHGYTPRSTAIVTNIQVLMLLLSDVYYVLLYLLNGMFGILIL